MVCVATLGGGSSAGYYGHFNLSAQPPLSTNLTYYSSTSYNWSIDYGPNLSLHHQVAGQYASTPDFLCSRGVSYPISWTVTITNACGSTVKSGSTAKVFFHKGVQSGNNSDNSDSTSYPVDSTVFYFNAIIPDSASQMLYDSTVYNRVSQTFISDTTDTVAISSTIEKIRFEELGPYIVFDTVAERQYSNLGTSHLTMQDITSIYPNPTNGELTINLSSKYGATQPVIVTVNDIEGKAVTTKEFNHISQSLINLNISSLPAAIYYLRIAQGDHSEYKKVIKENSK